MKYKAIAVATLTVSLLGVAAFWVSRSHANSQAAKGEAIVNRYIEENKKGLGMQGLGLGMSSRKYVDLLDNIAMGHVPGFFRDPCRYACTESEKEAVLTFVMKELGREGYFDQFEREPQDVPEAKLPQ